MSESDLPDYVKVNRDHWTKNNAAYTDGRAEHAWNEQEISWGVWNTPESEINVLPEVRGKDVVELGCGTAYVSAWLKRRGARRVVGVYITPAQLDSARRLNTKYGLGLELVEANAEATGLPGASFDLAISEYGASIWCDPYRWIPEAARLLRPNGELVFLRNSTLSILCMPDHGKVQDRLQRPQLGLNRLVVGHGRLGPVGEERLRSGQQLLLPGVDQGRVDPELPRQFVGRAVAFERRQGDLSFERWRVLLPLTFHRFPSQLGHHCSLAGGPVCGVHYKTTRL